jgi:RHS repeat-associated protein
MRTNYTIASNSNRLTSSNQGTDETKYEYDSAGNIIKVSPPRVGATNYVYDNLNRLAKVEVDGLQNGKTLASYQYNAFSQRIQKDVNGAKTIFIYNSAGQLLEEQNKQQNTIRDYVYVDGQLIAAIENGIISYITTDHLNAPQIITSQTGQTIWSAKYDLFGKATVTGNIKYNLRADGQYQDDETGLYYNWYRYYNPELGRYITSDPLGLQAGMNTYIYVNGNPINYTDPMGLAPPFSRRVGDIDVPMGIPALSIKDGFDDYVMPHSDTIAGYGDKLHLVIYKHARHALAYLNANNDYGYLFHVNECSQEYKYGGYAGDAFNTFMLGRGMFNGYRFITSQDGKVMIINAELNRQIINSSAKDAAIYNRNWYINKPY